MTFAARYNGWCPVCGTKIRVGDECDYAGSKVVHEGCTDPGVALLRDIFGHGDDEDDDDHEPQPVITGRRNHQRLCGDCHTIHAGDCW